MMELEVAELGFKQSPILLEHYRRGQASPSSDALMTSSIPCVPGATGPVITCPLKACTLFPKSDRYAAAFKST